MSQSDETRSKKRLLKNSRTDFDLNICVSGHSTGLQSDYSYYSEWGPLIRDYYTIHCCIEGRGILYVNDMPFAIEAGQCFASFPGSVIIQKTDELDPWELLYIGIKGSKTSVYLRKLGVSELNPVFKWNYTDQIISCMEKIIAMRFREDHDSELMQIVSVCMLFEEFNRLNAESPVESVFVKTDDYYINEAIQYMESNYYKKITIADIAERIGFNRSYFSRLFKNLVCVSPQTYLTNLRIKKACEFLVVPNSTVTSVANSVGYDSFVFSRIFHRVMGQSPTEYKKTHALSQKNSNAILSHGS